jgi:hypothetical protein
MVENQPIKTISFMLTHDKIIEIFCITDDFRKEFSKELKKQPELPQSDKVAVCLGFQDFSQLKRDYGDKDAAIVMNTVGSIFSGQVVGESAKNLSERFGKVLQKRQSMTINRQDKSTSIFTQLDSLIPTNKISNRTQGMFVGAVHFLYSCFWHRDEGYKPQKFPHSKFEVYNIFQ